MGEWLPLLALAMLFGGYLKSAGKRRRESARGAAPVRTAIDLDLPDPLADLARRRGLTLGRGRAAGEVRGVTVRVERNDDQLVLSAPLAHPLADIAAVRVRRAGDNSRPSVSVSPGFDRALVVELRRRSKGNSLGGALSDALLRAALEELEPELTSHRIRLSVPVARRAHEHQSALDQLIRIARSATAEVATEAKTPRERRVIAVWRRLGSVEEDPISLRLVRPSGTFLLELEEGARATHIELEFVSPVATDLSVISAEQRPEREREQDIELGDAFFDQAFVVSGDRAEAEEELGPSVRDALSALVRDGAAVEVRSDVLRIAVPGALASETDVEAWLAAMERVATTLTERESRSAYR